MIQLDQVTHHYGVVPILENLSLEIGSGEVVAVLGPNGMGKTTLLKLMAGILPPAKGKIHVHGLERRSTPEAESKIRERTLFLPDECWFPVTGTVRTFVLAVAELYGRDSTQAIRHAERLFDLFAMTEKADSLILSCSTGQRKKAALCSALISEASLLLLDEPFSGGLDPGGIVALKNVLKRICSSPNGKAEPRTVVFTTPVPEIIEEVADKILIIQSSQFVISGSPTEICQKAGETKLEKAIDQLLHSDTLDRVDRYFSKSA